MSRQRLRSVLDLYTVGRTITLRDGQPLWVQVLNPFEQDTARNEAQIAKARITLALKEPGSDETTKVRMYFLEDGLAEARAKLVDAKMAMATPRLIDGIKNDPEWTERLQIIERGSDDTARPLEPIESDLLAKITTEFTTELGNRLKSERQYLNAQYSDAEEDVLWAGYLEWYLERRASELMLAEFRLHQILFGTRLCNATDHGADTWTHENCEGHAERLFETKEEVRTAPEELVTQILDAFDVLEMSVRDAKNSDRQGSSSGSSPLPSVEAASTASTPTETPSTPPGTSPSPYPTPSPFSASAN